jgi:ATP-dependent helicase/nuclease subunit A
MPRNLVLAASAGTGKTHALVGIVIHLLLGARRGGAVDPTRIVATTFSRKAAAEIRTRVSLEIERLAQEPESSLYAAGAREAAGTTDAELAKRARGVLGRLHLARFGTLHSFATSIVERYAVELGLGPGFEVAGESDARARADEAIAHALEKRLADTHGTLRSLIEAAGSVDRLVSSLRRVLGQLEEDGRPAHELEIDVSDARRIEAQMLELVTHAREIARHPRCEEPAHELLRAWNGGDDVRLEQAAAALTALRATAKKPPELEAFFVFRNDLPGSPNEEKGRRLVRTWRVRETFGQHATVLRDVLAEAEREIERVGRLRAVLGFGEVLRAARELLRERPDVAEELGSGIEALLVDEFQDTSRVQRDLLQLLWARPDARSPTGVIPPIAAMRTSGLLVVGDRKQSIYGFRGADVGVFAELAVGLAGTPAREALGIPAGVTWEPATPLADFHALRENRRSVPSILAFANGFSARRFQIGEPPPELFEIEYVPATEDLLVPHTDDPPTVGALPGPPATTWLRIRPKGPSSTRLEEALTIAERTRIIVRDGSPRLGKERRPPTLRDIAVLATTNGMLDAVAFALAQADIPYVVAGKSFFRAREISDLGAMLSLVLDPGDRLAILEVLRGPWASVHDETLLGLVEPGKGLVGPAAWRSPPVPELVHEEDRSALHAVGALVLSLNECAGRLGAGAILREAVTQLDLEAVLEGMPRGQQRVANVEKLLAMADRHPDAREFLAWLEDAAKQEVAEAEAAAFSDSDDAVRLLTVHASKGLDFPIVFVPEIGGALPRTERSVARVALGSTSRRNTLSVRIADDLGLVLEPPSYVDAHARGCRRERAERQRLAYVAMTRAADALFLVGGRASEGILDPGTSTIAAVEMMPSKLLLVEDVEPPAPSERAPALRPPPERGALLNVHRREPPWRVLPIAPTALADFEHCPRRFELIHVLGLPEHARGLRVREVPDTREAIRGSATGATPLDAQAQGTLAHRVLERIPARAFSGSEESSAAVLRAIADLGVSQEHPQHDAISRLVLRFLKSDYARAIGEREASIAREVAFTLPIEDEAGRAVMLSGSIDLVVEWRDGLIDVVDYKSARSSATENYAFQLAVYALAAGARFRDAARVRTGIAFLGDSGGDPVWRELPEEREVRARISKLGSELVDARWSDSFPRVAITRCERIHCGFIGRCHPRAK